MKIDLPELFTKNADAFLISVKSDVHLILLKIMQNTF